MDKEIRVKFNGLSSADLIGVVTITDGIKSGIVNLLEVRKKLCKGKDFEVEVCLSILDKSELIIDEDVDRSKLDRDHHRDNYIPDVLICKFYLDEGCETGYFVFGVDDLPIDACEYSEYLEFVSETVSVKDILE